MREPCRKCKLHKKCKSPFLYKEQKKDKPGSKRPILVVGSYPRLAEDDAKDFFADRPGQLIKNLGSRVDVPVVYHMALSCPTRVKPKPQHFSLCREATFEECLHQHKPAVIICFGSNALNWATGDPDEALYKRRRKPFQLENAHGKPWVLTVPHPIEDRHFCPDWKKEHAEDLIHEWVHTFCLAERIVKEKGYKVPRHNITLVTSIAQAQDLLKRHRDKPIAVMDTETGQWDTNPDCTTLWHEKAEHLMTSWTFRVLEGGEYFYDTYVLMGEGNFPEVNRELFEPRKYGRLQGPRGPIKRRVVCHNRKHDFNVFVRFQGIPAYTICKGRDTFLMAALRDQSKIGYGLKKQAQFYFGADDWDKELKDERKAIQKVFDWKSWGYYVEAKKRGKSGKDVWRKGTKDYQMRTISKLYARLVRYGCEIEPKMFADYRHVNRKRLAYYCAMDTYWTARLYFEIYTQEPYNTFNVDTYEASERATDNLARIELAGLPMSLQRVNEAAAENDKKIAKMEEEFLALPLVKKTHPDVWKRELDKESTERLLNAKKYLAELVRITDVEVPLTEKSGEPSLKAPVKCALAAVSENPDDDGNEVHIVPIKEKTPVQYLWWKFLHLQKAYDLNSKFYKSYPRYALNNTIHTNFRIAKTEGGDSDGQNESKTYGAKTGRLSSTNPQTQNIWDYDDIKACFCVPALWNKSVA